MSLLISQPEEYRAGLVPCSVEPAKDFQVVSGAGKAYPAWAGLSACTPVGDTEGRTVGDSVYSMGLAAQGHTEGRTVGDSVYSMGLAAQGHTEGRTGREGLQHGSCSTGPHRGEDCGRQCLQHGSCSTGPLTHHASQCLLTWLTPRPYPMTS